jgi:hypothetical protein
LNGTRLPIVNGARTLKRVAHCSVSTLAKSMWKQILTCTATIAGQTCSALLLQHKKSLGIKHIAKITVFRGNTFRGQYLPQMLFNVEDVPTNLLRADPPAGWIPPQPQSRPGLSNPPPNVPGPLPNPQPVIPGPSTPLPSPIQIPDNDLEDMWRRDISPRVSYQVGHEQNGNNSIRTHIYRIV